ncbi:hypothetical protein EVG20_g4743 [Dentipellis fragilis]|uniref:Uncharacterized protein n=1 Tax=Dentipellis fragilis TaxID=205917 RepID=A0A4Y9YUU5_9AGAM|nr:hypothetical protein EVG20_g4743 [Dentipellis fragilis]
MFGSQPRRTGSAGALHHLEYSKSSRAKCHGPLPCKGSPIALGALRYGRTITNHYGETVQWTHWYSVHRGCLTPTILAQLAGYGVHRISGFGSLRSEDQHKIRRALASRRIDPEDIPESAKAPAALIPAPSSSQPPPSSQVSEPPSSSQPSMSQSAPTSTPVASGSGPSQRKRKAELDAAFAEAERSLSAPGGSQPKPLASQPGAPRMSAYEGVRKINNPAGATWEEGVENDAPPEESIDELYCTMSTNVVGVQYYKGLVDSGEQVRLVREPQNKYDRMAIQVKNIGGTQVGHLPRTVASKLSPLLDRQLVTVEGTMNEGNLRGFSYSLSVTLKIYGAMDKRDQLEPQLVWATPGQRGFPKRAAAAASAHAGYGGPGLPSAADIVGGSRMPSAYSGSAYGAGAYAAGPSASQARGMTQAQIEVARKQQESFAKAAELRQILNSLEKVDDEGRRSSLLDTLCSTEDVLSLPLYPNPPSIESGELRVNLLKHQAQALQWCIDHEYPKLPEKETDKPVQFWQYRKMGAKSYYYNIATKSPQEAKPELGRGALCADSMGLGKTLTMISLILATKDDNSSKFSKSTLIVVPLSVLSNWEKQIDDHCMPGAVSYCVYYGTGRSMSAKDLQKYDVVLTTYQTVTKEHENAAGLANGGGAPSKKKKKIESSLFGVAWKRVILDEGHNIRNPRTKMAQSVYALASERRWVLTGTPIINSPQDLGSIVTFLRICRPLDNSDFYKRLLLRPLKDGDPSGAEMLRALMSQICIRRTKEMQDSDGNYLVPLPPVEMTLVPVELAPEARELYDTIEQLSKQRIEDMMNNPRGVTAFSISTNALALLTRLRQIALHPGLVPADLIQQLQAADDDHNTAAIQITPQERIRLQAVLAQAIEDNEECPICFGILDDPRITACSHRFCLPCITEVIARDPKCPMDRRVIGMGDLIEPPPPTELTQAPIPVDEDEEDAQNDLRTGSSAKIDQLVHLLKLTPGNEKSLVFSQFTSFLDKIAETLDNEGIPYVRFDGKMSARRRQETLQRFSIPLDDAAVQPASTPAPSQTQGRATRRRTATQASVDDVDITVQDQGDADDDFVPGAIDADDDDFLDDEDDDDVWTKKGKGKKGKGKAKAKGKSIAKARFAASTNTVTYQESLASGVNPKVMLISLKAGALGLNLTVANNVYLMDPWWQEGIESQAIDRCNRIGQKKPVHVYQLIAEDTVESKVIEIQEKKKLLIKEVRLHDLRSSSDGINSLAPQAFSGIKSKETQRQKKEARLQDLIQLFGIRQQAASQSS